MDRGPDTAPLVSVIIPVFNAERFLRRCLDSVIGQTMPDLEIIAVNDGSTDASLEILREYERAEPRLRVLDQANAGQGVARNRALDLARGRYVLFVDSDDFIETVTLQVTTERAEQDQSDLVHFDWKFVTGDQQRTRFDYYHTEPFWHLRILEGDDCELLFRMHSYFSVTNLYRRSFLTEHRIRYAEGQIYEDNPFLARVFSLAERVSLLHSPLYAIQANPRSSTKTGVETGRHMRDHLAAMRQSFAAVEARTAGARGDLAEYHLEKFSIYYERRVPRELRARYAREFVEIIAAEDVRFEWLGRKTSWITRACMRLDVFAGPHPRRLQALLGVKTRATPPAKRVLSAARKAKRRIRHPLRTLSNVRHGRSPELDPRTILFLGFDGRYTGNSRALFEQLASDSRFLEYRLLFATTDHRVPEEARLDPESIGFFRAAQSAGIVIAETWIPASVPKHPESTWIQLWHGTPIKRMLFDSHEPEIISRRPLHKVSKYRDIQRWDYLLVDGEVAASKFETAFLFPRDRMIRAEYPRVQALLERARTGEDRRRTRERLGVPEHGRLVLYAPTWRDYNYGREPEERDFSYQLDAGALAERLGEAHTVVVKDHDYLRIDRAQKHARVIDGHCLDIQALLLSSDFLISDYSSVAFDARCLGLPFLLVADDLRRFEESRGIYRDVWKSLAESVPHDFGDLLLLVEQSTTLSEPALAKGDVGWVTAGIKRDLAQVIAESVSEQRRW